MYRLSVPQGREADAGIYFANDLGSPALIAGRNAYTKVLYDFSGDSTLTFREREALRMGIAHMTDCNICKGFRPIDYPEISRPPPDVAAAAASVDEAFYNNVQQYRTWDGYSEREKLAIEFVDRMANDAEGMRDDDDFWVRLHKNFTEVEIGDLSIIGGAWVASVLTLRAFGFVRGVCDIALTPKEAVREPTTV